MKLERVLETSATRAIELAIQRAVAWEYPSLITGGPGTGKTTALKHFAAKYDGVYCEVDETTKSPGGMYHMLIKVFVGFRHGKTMRDDAAQLAAWFETERSWDRPRRPLFVDEQQTFEAPALRELLRVCERGAVPLVLAGNRERLAKHKKSDLGALDQIKSRIGHRVQIGSPDDSDCKSVAVEFNVEGMNAYAALATFGSNTNMRELVRLLREAREIAGPAGSIRMPHLESAALSIFGSGNALKLLVSEAA